MKLFQLIPFNRNRIRHWERVYKKNKPDELGWYQDYPETSLKLITATGVGVDSDIIDVGGGTSKLIGTLLDQGYKRLTVLDISGSSIEKVKINLGEKSNRINWIEADVTKYSFMEQYDIWHDRAVFHFLTEAKDRKGYINALNKTLKLNGHLIIATFALNGPPKCSGLPVTRYSPETLQNELGDNFKLVKAIVEGHVTPSGVRQKFIFCQFIKQA